jgi:SAM-dependent methyltransferase
LADNLKYQKIEPGVLVRPGYEPPFRFSDGDEVEQRIHHAVASSSDLATGSAELQRHITDWPTLYHLSPRRANLLRAIAGAFKNPILEIGCGCGALTRYLGETYGEVTALEASPRRAAIASLRCRGLSGVEVYADSLESFLPGRTFGTVVCVGVLEYAPVYFRGNSPLADALSRICDLLKRDGTLVIGIENQLGLRYFAGVPEDHIGIPYYGLEDRYAPGEPTTLGRRCWEDALRAAGFRSIDFFVPFPDYKLPQVVCSPKAFDEPRLDLASMLRSVSYPPLPAGQTGFLESAAWPVVLRNRLGIDLADSLLIVASRSRQRYSDAIPDLVSFYSDNRRRAFAKQTVFRKRHGRITVAATRLYPGHVSKGNGWMQVFEERPYLELGAYEEGLDRILRREGWSAHDLAAWASPWMRLLRRNSSAIGRFGVVSGDYLDCTPFNLLVDGAELKPFDLEYKAAQPLPLEYVAFRGLWSALFRLSSHAAPPQAGETRILSLVHATLVLLGVDLSPAELNALISREAAFQQEVTGAPAPAVEQTIRTAAFAPRRSASSDAGRAPGAVLSAPPANYAQVFWRAADCDFREEDSKAQAFPVSDGPQDLSIPLPPFSEPLCALRLDPACRPGMLADFSVRVFDAADRLVWSLETAAGEVFAALRDMVFLSRPAGRQGAVAALSGADPSFEIRLTPEQAERMRGGGRLQMRARWVLSPSELAAISAAACAASRRAE